MQPHNYSHESTATMTRYFEDFKVGEIWRSRPVTLSADDIVGFARQYDPQPIHTDAELAARSAFGALVASGWQIAAISMRLFIESGGYGKTPVIGLGIDELRWVQPVKAGDTLTVVREVAELRRSASNPAHGIVRTRVTVRNQADAVVMTLISAGRVPARPAAASVEGVAP